MRVGNFYRVKPGDIRYFSEGETQDMSYEMDEVKYQVAMANRVLADVGLATGVTAALGHASMRVPSSPDHFVVKGRQYALDSLSIMRPKDMIVCDLDGFMVDGPPGMTQCSEVKIHSCIYRTRPDVQSVVHVHPRYTVLMSVLQVPLVPMCQEGAGLVRDALPIYPHYVTIQSDKDGMEVATLLGNGKAVLLQGHGAVTAGRGLNESVMGMLQLEEQARMNYLAYCAAGRDHAQIPDALLNEGINRTPLHEQPHFKDVLKGQGPQRDGIWAHRIDAVSRQQ